MPSSGIAGSKGSSVLASQGTSPLFSTVRCQCTFPPAACRVPCSPWLEPALVVFSLFGVCRAYWSELVSHVVLICICLRISHVEPFHVPVGHFYIFFEKCAFRSIAHFSKSGCILLLHFRCSLYIWDINSLSVVQFANMFFHSVVCRLCLHSVECFLLCAEGISDLAHYSFPPLNTFLKNIISVDAS